MVGHVPLIDIDPRGDKALAEELKAEAKRLECIHFELPEHVQYPSGTGNVRRASASMADSKDEFGDRYVRVRGAGKVMCHCMFGILALTANQLLHLVT